LDPRAGDPRLPRVRATSFNHVSVHARDLQESVRFYTEVLGMEPIPTYTFAFPVQYLRLGDLQLHLFERDTPAPEFHHIGIDVDDFEGAYLKAKELNLHDSSAFYSDIYELPDGAVQMYIRDPAGNLVELDWPDVSTLDRSVLPEFKKLSDDVEQSADALRATLYLRLHEESSPDAVAP
jgi:catechol 2,3-dioxygenase-like lactoylglutathione lyase family enzyme